MNFGDAMFLGLSGQGALPSPPELAAVDGACGGDPPGDRVRFSFDPGAVTRHDGLRPSATGCERLMGIDVRIEHGNALQRQIARHTAFAAGYAPRQTDAVLGSLPARDRLQVMRNSERIQSVVPGPAHGGGVAALNTAC